MKIIELKQFSSEVPIFFTIGSFDGLHLGHSQVLKKLTLCAKSHCAKSLVILVEKFESTALPLLPRDEKEHKLEQLNIDFLIILNLSEIKELSWNYLLEELATKSSLAGFAGSCKIRFGKNREGTPERVKEWFKIYSRTNNRETSVDIIDSLTIENEAISSTTIRNLLAEGRVEEVVALLGEPFAVYGKIVNGKGFGRKLGFPTINVIPKFQRIPKEGVYAVKVRFSFGLFNGVCFIGKPLGDEIQTIEVHLLNFSKTVYNYEVEIYFIRYLRDVRKVSPTELIPLVEHDIQIARDLFQTPSNTL